MATCNGFLTLEIFVEYFGISILERIHIEGNVHNHLHEGLIEVFARLCDVILYGPYSIGSHTLCREDFYTAPFLTFIYSALY